jgi:hypothetical protein
VSFLQYSAFNSKISCTSARIFIDEIMEAVFLEQKVKQLPFEAHQEVSNYLDFLLQKYCVNISVKLHTRDSASGHQL